MYYLTGYGINYFMKKDDNTRNDALFLYEKVADRISVMVKNGTYRSNERIPSIRSLSRQLHVSINTVMEAYAHLENAGLIEARPQSGFYVSVSSPPAPNNLSFTDIAAGLKQQTYVFISKTCLSGNGVMSPPVSKFSLLSLPG